MKFDPDKIQYRDVEIRSVDTAKREVEGIAVPWGQTASIGGFYTEEMKRGAVQDSDDAALWWRHEEPIGTIVSAKDTVDGWLIRARISETPTGDKAYVLARDGVVKNFSIGFQPDTFEVREDDSGTHITHTKIRVREVSLVPLPAYDGAQVTHVREGNLQKGKKMDPEEDVLETREDKKPENKTVSVIDLEARSGVEDLDRQFKVFAAGHSTKAEIVVDTRSAAEVLKAIADGDETTIREYNELQERAYTGGVSSDGVVKDGWVGDLTRLVYDSAPLLSFFSSGVLPEQGNNIEFAELSSNTVAVAEQVAEGDDLTYGEVHVTTRTAPVKTYGGYSELSRRMIDRSSVNILQTVLEAQASATGQKMNAVLRAQFVTAKAAQVTAANTVAVPTASTDWADWLDALVDASIKFGNAPLGLPIDGLIVNAVSFKKLLHLEASDGRPVLLVDGNGSNNVGEINPKALSGKLAGCTVLLDPGLSIAAGVQTAAFVSKRAIRSYISPVTRLQDENIINLSKQYSVYNYAAFANEIPAALVPIVFA